MVMKGIAAGFKVFFRRCFHKRNIIIVSEHKVKHLHLSTATQCGLLAVLITLCFGASYYTGQYVAKSGVGPKPLQFVQVDGGVVAQTTEDGDAQASVQTVFLPDMADAQKMEKDELIARVAILQQQVTDLENSKKDMIERVRDKTSGQIDKLERIIKQTGLSPQELRKQYTADADKEDDMHVGGPYIPDNQDDGKFTTEEQALYDSLDDLAMLRDIISDLPLSMPLKHAELHSSFGRRIDPFTRRMAFHSGLDFAGPSGSRVRSTADGVVIHAKESLGYGNFIDVAHGYDLSTRYAHLSRILVVPGQKVKRGDVIGIQGSTGRSTGEHLHYEVRYRNQALNPKRFVDAGQYVSEEE